MVDAVSKHATSVTTALGIDKVLDENTTGIPAAVALAKAADTVVVAVGTDLSWAAEGHDAHNISFTNAQMQLITQAADAAKKPIIVVIMTATPVRENRRTSASHFYPGPFTEPHVLAATDRCLTPTVLRCPDSSISRPCSPTRRSAPSCTPGSPP